MIAASQGDGTPSNVRQGRRKSNQALVLSNGDRILTQSDFMEGMGMYYSGWVAKNRPAEDAAADVPHFLSFKSLKPFVDKHLGDLQSIVVKYRTEKGNLAHGIKADVIPKVLDVWLDADEHGNLGARQKLIAANPTSQPDFAQAVHRGGFFMRPTWLSTFPPSKATFARLPQSVA